MFHTCAAFFESKPKHFFIYPNTTLCYFYIIRDPKDLFIRYKNKLKTTEEAYNELFNYTEKLYLSESLEQNQFKIFENKTDYNTNTNSWSDPNVLSTYKGKLISYDNLVNNTEEVLTEIIQHLKQYHPELNIDYQTIKNYVYKNELRREEDQEISKSENKFLLRNIKLINHNIKDL